MLLPVYEIQDAEFARRPAKSVPSLAEQAWSHEDSYDQRVDLGLAQHPVAHRRLGNAADRWPMLIDQCSGLFERAIEEIGKLPGAFALQRNVLAFHDLFTPTSQLQLE